MDDVSDRREETPARAETRQGQARLVIAPIEANHSLKDKIYDALKSGITTMNIYAEDADLRLDERKLSEQMSISRTPIREALARLEQEGLVQIMPRKGVFIVRKTKTEILDMVTVWAALESMAARLATERASDEEIANLRKLYVDMNGEDAKARIDEYSDKNIEFHQAILGLSKCPLLREMADPLFIHMRSIRARTIGDADRAVKSVIDHLSIIEALEARDANLAAELVRTHNMNLAGHIERFVDYLD